ncbi:MAG: lycopene cyclase domain-containing protein [Myxococcaceae bacterium]
MREPLRHLEGVNRLTLPVRPRSAEHRVVALFGTLAASAAPCLACDHHGYTWSLLMFAAPAAAIAVLYRQAGWMLAARRPVLLALAVLAPMGVGLNLVFAHRFFVYPNRDAVLGLYLRGIPVEEFAFYTLGFLALMLGYLWVRHELLGAHEAPISVVRARPAKALLWSVGLLLLACGLKHGVPGYLSYLLLVPLPALLTGLPVVRPRLHWPSVAMVLMALLLVSVTWEASLAVPGGWWGYQHEAMVGLFIRRWSGLPLEAVLVWFESGLTAVVMLELLLNRQSKTRGGSARRTAPASALR